MLLAISLKQCRVPSTFSFFSFPTTFYPLQRFRGAQFFRAVFKVAGPILESVPLRPPEQAAEGSPVSATEQSLRNVLLSIEITNRRKE